MRTVFFPENTCADFLDIRLLAREDDISSDADIAKVVQTSSLVSLRQMHGNSVHVVREPSSRLLEGDALATDVHGLTLTIRFADCQGFVVVDPTKKVFALIHAGWKGMQQKVISSTFFLLASEWRVKPKDVYVLAGPSLCTQCAVFTDPLREAPELSAFIEGSSTDLPSAADAEFLSLGVVAKKMHRIEECTRCHPDEYFTYRGGDRDAVIQGRTNCFAVRMR